MAEPHWDKLVDARLGLVRRLIRFDHGPELPAALISFSADVSSTQRWGPFQADRVALGAAFRDPERARKAALGEAVERYCGNIIPHTLRRASYRDLQQEDIPALKPDDLVLYASTQYAQRGFPFVPFAPDLQVRWVEAHDMHTGEATLVPASVVYVNFYTGAYADEPHTNFVMYSGLACGASREAAERSALEELIERDATMIWWLSNSPAQAIALDDCPALQATLVARKPGDIVYHLIAIPTTFAVPVIGALIVDQAQQIAALGVACRPTALAAAEKALVEAIHLRIYAQGLLDPNGHVWQGIRAGILDPRSYKPYRTDRRYRDSFRADFRDVIDLGSQAQIYLDPRMHAALERITVPPQHTTLEHLPHISTDTPRAAYLRLLEARGFRAYTVDLTTPDVRAAGLHVVRVVVPGFYPNAPAAFPFLGGKRLYHEPYEQGWLPHILAETDVVRVPLPHT
jgi:ribosomal protein S12 methylthiotransferase accessory factor